MKTFIATLTLATALLAGTASAMTTSGPVNSVVGLNSASVNYSVDNGVATLFGDVESGIESVLAQAHIEKMQGVDKVINLITVN